MESLAEDFKLSTCWRQPSSFSLLFDLGVSVLFFVIVFFRSSVCSSLRGASSYVMPDLRRSSGIVFLDTLETMCHFSLGMG